jgi:predicted nucleic acid-binding protein
MSGRSFVDTNIWIYAHLRTPNEPRHARALALVEHLADGVISAQVASEYYSVMLRSKQSDDWIQKNLGIMLGYVRLQPVNETVLREAWRIRDRYGFSIWDSQIVAAAIEAGCRTLFTEDLQHGQIIETLAIVDPFQG